MSNIALAGGEVATEQIMVYVCRPFNNQHSYFFLMSHMIPGCRPMNSFLGMVVSKLGFQVVPGNGGQPYILMMSGIHVQIRLALQACPEFWMLSLSGAHHWSWRSFHLPCGEAWDQSLCQGL